MKLDRVAVKFEYKALAEADAHVFEGYGSVFGGVDSYGDTIQKGAFKLTLKEWKAKGRLPKMLLQHGGWAMTADDMTPIGKWEEMREDDTGLYVKGRLFDVQTDRARNTYVAMKEGELDGLSIGFQTRKSKMDEETGIRTLTEIELWEISPVTFGADRAALITGVKSDGELPTERELERWLRREAGLTKDQAKVVIAKGYRQVRREAMSSEEACGELLTLCNQRAAIFSGEQKS
jgi:Escherichia/Staphylococcus phage prohead protease